MSAAHESRNAPPPPSAEFEGHAIGVELPVVFGHDAHAPSTGGGAGGAAAPPLTGAGALQLRTAKAHAAAAPATGSAVPVGAAPAINAADGAGGDGNGEFDESGRAYDRHIAPKAYRVWRGRRALLVLVVCSIAVLAYGIDAIVRYARNDKRCDGIQRGDDAVVLDTLGYECRNQSLCSFTPAGCGECNEYSDDVTAAPGAWRTQRRADTLHTNASAVVSGSVRRSVHVQAMVTCEASQCYVVATCRPYNDCTSMLGLMCAFLGTALFAVIFGLACRLCEPDSAYLLPATFMWLGSTMAITATAIALSSPACDVAPLWASGIVFGLSVSLWSVSTLLLVWKRCFCCRKCFGADGNFGARPGYCYGMCCTVDLYHPPLVADD